MGLVDEFSINFITCPEFIQVAVKPLLLLTKNRPCLIAFLTPAFEGM
ncbi:hypothetical protein [Lutibacter profundi]|nr:hypothetical protein [Lutibacter profundi]